MRNRTRMAPVALEYLAVRAGDGEVQARQLRVAREGGFGFGDAIGTRQFNVVVDRYYDWCRGCAQPDVAAFASTVVLSGDIPHVRICRSEHALQFRLRGIIDDDNLRDLVRVSERRLEGAPKMLM